MKTQLARRLPSRAMGVALVALFVALAGTSYAAFAVPPGSVGTSQLKNGAVTTPKLAYRAVTGGKVALSTLGTVPSARTANAVATEQITTSTGSIPPGESGSYVPTCPAGWAVISGGYENSNPLTVVTESSPYNENTQSDHGGTPNAWILRFDNDASSSSDTIRVWATCLRAGSVLGF